MGLGGSDFPDLKNLGGPMGNGTMVISGTSGLLKQITSFCREVYHRTFGPEEGERRFLCLTVVAAVALWHSGLPDSALISQPPNESENKV